MTYILGIESSCDETAAAVVCDGRIVYSNIIASQHDLHERYLGVVPEIASRAHLERITPVIEQALQEAGLSVLQIDAVAVGNRPGLIGSLLVGLSAAKAFAWSMDKPLIGVDHVRAHLYAAALRERVASSALASEAGPVQHNETRTDGIAYPALGLVVSGGHTSLYSLQSPTEIQLLGSTIDDAVGEAYDKAAVILQLGFPGGPRLDKLAQQGDPQAYDLPRSMLGKESLDFSFSGLKTAMLYKVRGIPEAQGNGAKFQRDIDDLSEVERRNLAASFQHAAIDAIVKKLLRAIDYMTEYEEKPKSIVIGGGVSANSLLRTRAVELGKENCIAVHLPAMRYCLDNAAMIAGLAFHDYCANRFDTLDLPAIATTRI